MTIQELIPILPIDASCHLPRMVAAATQTATTTATAHPATIATESTQPATTTATAHPAIALCRVGRIVPSTDRNRLRRNARMEAEGMKRRYEAVSRPRSVIAPAHGSRVSPRAGTDPTLTADGVHKDDAP